MELITRRIIRKKNDRELVYKFTTYSIIFESSAKKGSNFQKLQSHLMKAFMFGMKEAEKSPSNEPALECEIKHWPDHEFTKYANGSAYYGRGTDQHWIAQMHFMRNHPNAIAVELPVWTEECSGCMDILFYYPETDRLIIYDFKPNAKAEKSVSGQLFKYAQLLSKRTGISLNHIDLFYGDGENTYQVIV